MKPMLTTMLIIGLFAVPLWAQVDIQSIKTQLEAAQAYGYDQSRETLTRLEQAIRAVESEQPATKAEVENLLLGSLTQGVSDGLRDFICRQLSIVGSARSVPLLLPLLQAPATAEPARYALERIPSSSVDDALRASLSSARGQIRLGIITTLGARGDDKSVSMLAPLLKDSDSDTATACAAVAALGRIGTAEAAKALSQVRNQVPPAVQPRILDAILQCAEAQISQHPQQAAEIYRSLYDKKYNPVVQAAALRGLARTEPSKRMELIMAVLRGSEEKLKPTALALVQDISDPLQIQQMSEAMPELSPAHRVLLLTNLALVPKAQGHTSAALPYVKTAAKDKNLDVRVAALDALGVIGDATCVDFLASSAAIGQTETKQVARDSLHRLSGEGVDEEIVRLIRESKEPPVRVELIRAVESRRTGSAAQTLMEAVNSEDRMTTQASLKALAQVGRVQDVPILIQRLITRTRMDADLEDALVGIAERNHIQDDMVNQVLVVSGTPSVEVQRSMLRLLARLGGDKGLTFVERSLGSANGAVRTEAARALSVWPTRTGMALARRIAEADGNPTHRILALRGYIQMAVLPSSETPQQVFNTLWQAMDLATRDDERWLILSAMTQAPCKESLIFVQSQLTSDSLAAEAQSAVVAICQSLVDAEPDLVRAALNQVLAGDPNRSIRRDARILLRRL